MANEISYSFTFKAVKGGVNENINSGTLKANILSSTPRQSSGIQSIGTAHEALELGADLGNIGWTIFRNTDATNFVEIGHWDSGTSVFYPVIRLYPGETFPVRLSPSAVLHAKADTATVDLYHEHFTA